MDVSAAGRVGGGDTEYDDAMLAEAGMHFTGTEGALRRHQLDTLRRYIKQKAEEYNREGSMTFADEKTTLLAARMAYYTMPGSEPAEGTILHSAFWAHVMEEAGQLTAGEKRIMALNEEAWRDGDPRHSMGVGVPRRREPIPLHGLYMDRPRHLIRCLAAYQGVWQMHACSTLPFLRCPRRGL